MTDKIIGLTRPEAPTKPPEAPVLRYKFRFVTGDTIDAPGALAFTNNTVATINPTDGTINYFVNLGNVIDVTLIADG